MEEEIERLIQERKFDLLVKFGPKVTPYLIKFLKDRRWWYRANAAAVIRTIGDKSAVPALLESLNDEHWWVRLTILSAIEVLGDSSCVQFLVNLLQREKHSEVRRSIVFTIEKLIVPHVFSLVISPLMEVAKKEDEDVFAREGSIKILGRIAKETKDIKIIEFIVERLKDKNPVVIDAVMYTLEKIGEDCIPFIEKLMNSFPETRMFCVKLIAKIRGPQSIPLLLSILFNDNSTEMLMMSLSLISEVADISILPELEKFLQKKQETHEIQIVKKVKETIQKIQNRSSQRQEVVSTEFDIVKEKKLDFNGYKLEEIIFGDVVPSEEIQQKINEIISSNPTFYSDLIYKISGVRFDENFAKRLWVGILSHRHVLREKIGRDVGIQVATLDYLQNVVKVVKSAKIIDEDEFLKKEIFATIDYLTGLYNRRSFFELVNKYILDKQNLCLIAIDLDNFKIYNDTKGHIAGDELLKQFSKLLKSRFSSEKQFVGRYGGDEFVVCILDKTKSECVKELNTFKEEIKSTFPKEISFSFGIAVYPDDGNDIQELFSKADQELYNVKRKRYTL